MEKVGLVWSWSEELEKEVICWVFGCGNCNGCCVY